MIFSDSLVKQHPACPHRSENYCEWLSSRLARPYHVSPVFCNFVCEKSGPYCGRELNLDDEKKFLHSAFWRLPPVGGVGHVVGIRRRQQKPFDICIPPEHPAIREALSALNGVAGYRGYFLSGSMVCKNVPRPLKDYDVVLWFEDVKSVLALDKSKLPQKVNGTMMDYFYHIGTGAVPDLYFACLDPEKKILYTSRWFELNIVSLSDGITVVKQDYAGFDELLDEVPAWINREIAKPGAVPQAGAKNWKLNLWHDVKSFWEKAETFVVSAKSRGLAATATHLVATTDAGNRISETILAERKASCFEPCEMVRDVLGAKYCGACGCGDNKLARLDGEGYTKLHYPQLACPLQKRGFSNFKPRLSIIITVLNDQEELTETVKSIRDTSPLSEVEIIVIDDCSDVPAFVDEHVVLHRNSARIGCGASRHSGVSIAHADYVLLTDSHMRFVPGWYQSAMERITGREKTLHCAVCLGLGYGNMDLAKYNGTYHGADFILHSDERKQTFEAVWSQEKEGDDYEIACVMGACYFIPKKFFLVIGGLKSNWLWGVDEQMLSLKAWLAGGEVRMMKTVRIGHKFRDKAPYSTKMSSVVYNKLRSVAVICPEQFQAVARKLSQTSGYLQAKDMIRRDAAEIAKERGEFKRIAVRDFNWFLDKFGIPKIADEPPSDAVSIGKATVMIT